MVNFLFGVLAALSAMAGSYMDGAFSAFAYILAGQIIGHVVTKTLYKGDSDA